MLVGGPDRRADVEAPVGFVRMSPELAAIRRIHAGHHIAAEDHELRLLVDVDQNRRRGRPHEVAVLPQQLAGGLIECRHRLVRSAHRHDDGAVVQEGTAAVAASSQRRVELFDEVVRPDSLARRLVEGEELAARARGEQTIANDQRRAVRTESLIELNTVWWCRILEFPDRLAARSIERGDDLFVRDRWLPRDLPVHRVEASVLDEHSGVPFTETAAPQLFGSARRPARGQPFAVGHEVAIGSAPLCPRGTRLGNGRLRTISENDCDESQEDRVPYAHGSLRS